MSGSATDQAFRGHGKWLRRSRMASPHNRKQNSLLAALPDENQIRLFPQMELVELSFGQILFGAELKTENVYFPISGTVSLCYDKDASLSAELAIVGRDGMVGINLLMEGDGLPHQAVVQCSGHAYRINGVALKQEFDRKCGTYSLLSRYIQAQLGQMARASECNRDHTVDQQLCRWLLQRVDHLPSSDLSILQETVTSTLGAERERVIEATAKLQADGLIRSSRNHIHLLNRSGLEERACQCYHSMKSEFDNLFLAETI